LLYVATEKSERKNRNLARVRDILVSTKTEFEALLNKMLGSDNRIVQSTAARTIAKEEKLRSSVVAVLQSHTHFLDSPRIRRSLARSDFRFEDLKTSKMTVYLVLPADRLEPFGRWLRLLVQQAITVNARNIEQKPEKPVLFLLDEMAALGRLTMIEQAFSLMAGFGMQLWGIVQDLSQLERIYDKGWETFIGNSGILQYFGSRDLKTAEYFSKLCGVITTEKFSWSNAVGKALGWSKSWGVSSQSTSNSGAQGGGSSSTGTNMTEGISSTDSETDTENQDIIQRPLIFPDELMVMRRDECLVLVENLNPVRTFKVRWYESDDFRKFGVNLHEPTTPPPAAA
jgi:type IV secretion system protein VirD4